MNRSEKLFVRNCFDVVSRYTLFTGAGLLVFSVPVMLVDRWWSWAMVESSSILIIVALVSATSAAVLTTQADRKER